MAVAATAGLIDVPEQHERRAMLSTTPVYAFAGEQQQNDTNTLRRERDEAGPHYVSYSAYQRTPGRSKQ
jgi:hypothetical protein